MAEKYIQTEETTTPERCLKAGGVVIEFVDSDEKGKKRIKRQRVRIECMIDYYWETKRIDLSQLKAAHKFRGVYHRVNCGYNTRVLSDLVLVDNTRPAPDGKMATHIDCIHGLNAACKKLTRIQLSVIKDVCVHDRRAGNKDRLKILVRGLERLAAHWGM